MNGDTLEAGSTAPEFVLPDQNGADHALLDYRENWVLLCFYPHDDVAKCARELLSLRDHFDEFKKLGIRVFGISADSVDNHGVFAEQNKLPFILLSDVQKKIAKQYDALARQQYFDDNDDISQISFLINPAGDIEKIYRHIKPNMHASDVLADFAKMKKEDKEGADSIDL